MRLLLDTHILLSMLRQTLARDYPTVADELASPIHAAFASVASLWEIAIKARLGKLDPGMALEAITGYLGEVDVRIMSIEARHAVAIAQPEPPTRDPFDRLLLAQCQVEGLRLVTVDRALTDHPLAFNAV
jgi:PIN domain nuclease of toxin-antitoxin system